MRRSKLIVVVEENCSEKERILWLLVTADLPTCDSWFVEKLRKNAKEENLGWKIRSNGNGSWNGENWKDEDNSRYGNYESNFDIICHFTKSSFELAIVIKTLFRIFPLTLRDVVWIENLTWTRERERESDCRLRARKLEWNVQPESFEISDRKEKTIFREFTFIFLSFLSRGWRQKRRRLKVKIKFAWPSKV